MLSVLGHFTVFNLIFKRHMFLNPSLAINVMCEIPVAKLGGGGCKVEKLFKNVVLKNDTVKIALWYYTYMFPIFLLRC